MAAGRLTAGRWAARAPASSPSSGSTTSTHSSTTTPGSPTPRSCPTRRAPPALRSCSRAIGYFAAHGIPRIEQLMTDNAWAYKYSLRDLCATAGHQAGLHPPALPVAERARWSASTAPCSPSGPTARSSSPTTNAQPPLHPGSSTTTLNDATAHSEDSRPSAGCYQPEPDQAAYSDGDSLGSSVGSGVSVSSGERIAWEAWSISSVGQLEVQRAGGGDELLEQRGDRLDRAPRAGR